MAEKHWLTIINIRGTMECSVTLEAGDTTNVLRIPNFPDKTAHIYGGSFGNSTVSLKGSNNESATFQNLHRTDDSTETFTGVATATLAHVLENPTYLQASASGTTGTGLVVAITASTPRG
jgi:hypothetical protein